MELSKIFSALADASNTRSSVASSLLSAALGQYQNKNYQAAISTLRAASAYQPDSVDIYNTMASAYTQVGDTSGAIRSYKLSLKIDNSQGNVHMSLGNIYLSQNNYTEAEKEFKSAAQSDKTSAAPPYTLGLMYKDQGRTSEAEAMLLKSAKLNSKDGNPHYALGALYNELGRYDEAVSELQTALNLKSDFPLANYELGKAYAGLGNTDEAQKQADILADKDTSLYYDLKDRLAKPEMFSFNSVNSSFNAVLGAGTPLYYLDSSLIEPNASKDFTVQIQFDSEMDTSSVTNIANWNISKARGGSGGLYNNGLYGPNDVNIPLIPKSVVYDADSMQATVIFSLTQNESVTATIDPSHVVFKFMGKDVSGKSMDESADQFDGFSGIF